MIFFWTEINRLINTYTNGEEELVLPHNRFPLINAEGKKGIKDHHYKQYCNKHYRQGPVMDAKVSVCKFERDRICVVTDSFPKILTTAKDKIVILYWRDLVDTQLLLNYQGKQHQ